MSLDATYSELKCTSLFTEGGSVAYPMIAEYTYPWEVIPHIKEIIYALAAELDADEYYSPCEGVWISKSAEVAPSAFIGAPAIIMSGASVRHCAFIRGSALIGRGAVIGNSTEIKNAIIFDGAEIPHFNYVGDSIIGKKAHLGASAVTSNIKSDRTGVTVRIPPADGDQTERRIETALRKMGAALGDGVEVGCGTVLNPGTVIGKSTTVYPRSSVRGYIPPGVIYKSDGNIVKKR